MTRVIKGQTLSFTADGKAMHESRGAIAIGDDGVILWAGPQSLLPQGFQQAEVDDHGDMLVMPGFIDAHIHFPQYRMLAAPGKDLLDWLTRFTFPEESRYADGEYARAAAQLFLSRLFQHGTTSALAFCSVHKTCADALFAAAQDAGMALVTGKTMMDRNAIPAVEDTPETPSGSIEQMLVSRTSAAPGERVDLTVGWRAFQRDAESELVSLAIPADWAGKELEVILTTGPALDELTGRSHSVPIAQLRNFEEYISALREFRETDGLYLAVVEKARLMTDQRATTTDMPGSLERIARSADEARFQRRDAFTPLWEQRVLPGRLFNIMVRRPLNITD